MEIFNNPASNFYNQIHEFFLNLAAYGTAIFYIEEDPNLPHQSGKRSAEQLGREQLRKIYHKTFCSGDGKIILEDLASMSGMYRSNFIKGASDYTAFLEGHRALFLYICSQLEDDTDNIEGNKD